MSQVIVEHATNTAKVVAGGLGVGGGTYVTVASMSIEHATAIATLTATTATALYFLIMASYTAWKWIREARGSR